MSEYTNVQASLADGIAKALSSDMITRWVVVIESIDENGDKGLWSVAQEDMRIWDSFGLLTSALQTEQIKMIQNATE